MGKSHGESDKFLRRFAGDTVPSISETWVGLLTVMPTSSSPTGYQEWRETDDPSDVIIVRKRVYPGVQSNTTLPYWSDPAVDGSAKEIHNTNGVRWISTETSTLLNGAETVLGVGIFASETGSDLIYWNELTTNMTVSQGESVVFLDGKIKVTEQ